MIAFDLDDTLFKEMSFVASGYRAVADAVAVATGADADALFDIICRNRPLGYEAVIEYVEGRPGAESISVGALVEIYNSHTPDIRLNRDVEETLEALKAARHTLVLITDGTSGRQRSKIRALGLERFFGPEAILISGETGGDKTSEVPWTAAEKLDDGRGRIYVGDNPAKDFRLPNRRGWVTVMLRDRTGENVHAQNPLDFPPENRPRLTIDRLSDLATALS